MIKSHGAREPFDPRRSSPRGQRRGSTSHGRTDRALEHRSRGSLPAPGNGSHPELGLEVLERLRSLDVVTYLRYASVYKNFDAAADFQRELVLLKKLERT